MAIKRFVHPRFAGEPACRCPLWLIGHALGLQLLQPHATLVSSGLADCLKSPRATLVVVLENFRKNRGRGRGRGGSRTARSPKRGQCPRSFRFLLNAAPLSLRL